jgi:transcriptional regulator with XRE-family HTH domain
MGKSDTLQNLGKRIREIRVSKGMSQRELALKIEKDRQSIGRLETGNINPSYLYLLEIAGGLDVNIEELFVF